jgi:hypothetical protein
MPIRRRLRNSWGDPGTQGLAGNQGFQAGVRRLWSGRQRTAAGQPAAERSACWAVRPSEAPPSHTWRGLVVVPPPIVAHQGTRRIRMHTHSEPTGARRRLWTGMWIGQWTSAGKQGITASCPVDSQRIFRLPAQSPCASQRPGSRNSLTTKRGIRGRPRRRPGAGRPGSGRHPDRWWPGSRPRAGQPAAERSAGSGCQGRARPLHLIHGGASVRCGTVAQVRRSASRMATYGDPGRRPSTNCAQRVTPRAMADDNQTDAGDVGTPELTSPRLHLRGRRRWRPAREFAAAAAALRAGSTPWRRRPVAFGT